MNRTTYFNYIEEKLNINAVRIEARGKLNILDLNQHSENFYNDFLNKLYGWNLANLNELKQNVEAIDLVDEENRLIVQVSATATKRKLDNSFSKQIYKDYVGFTFKFVSISKDFKIKDYKIPNNIYNLKFDPDKDIIDKNRILKKILGLDIIHQEEIYKFIKRELGNEIDILKMDSNLATIINILAAEDLNHIDTKYEINDFEINKKIQFNNLNNVKDIIDDYKIYHSKIDEKYMLFDKNGVNKSLTILQTIRNKYYEACKESNNECEIFLIVMDKVTNIILNSKNYKEIPYEELEFCVGIIVVDAFIRCKIFKNPEGYNYVIAR